MPHPSHIVQAIIPTFSLTNLFMTVYNLEETMRDVYISFKEPIRKKIPPNHNVCPVPVSVLARPEPELVISKRYHKQ